MPSGNLDMQLGKLRIDKSRKRPRRGFGVGALLFILLVGAAGLWVLRSWANKPIEVKVVALQQDVANAIGREALTASGYAIPRQKIEISSKVIGRVKEALVGRGEFVKQGAVILRIEDDEYQAQVRLAEARVASVKARLDELKAGSRPQEIKAAQAAVASADATEKKTKQDLVRSETLARTGAISKQEFDQAQAAYRVAAAELKSAQERDLLVEEGPRKEVIAAAAADLHQAEADLAFAKTQLEYTVIHAPISGTILEKLAEQGELVTNINFGGTRGAKSSVVSMADLNDLQVEADINQNDISKVHSGQSCEIRLDSHPDKVFQGTVDEIAPEADRQKATVQVKVRLLNPGGMVRPEVSARVTFLNDAEKGASQPASAPGIWIPREALVESASGPRVYVATGGSAVARSVKVRGEGARGVEIGEGLIGTESLIVSPLDKIKEGTKIGVAPAGKP